MARIMMRIIRDGLNTALRPGLSSLAGEHPSPAPSMLHPSRMTMSNLNSSNLLNLLENLSDSSQLQPMVTFSQLTTPMATSLHFLAYAPQPHLRNATSLPALGAASPAHAFKHDEPLHTLATRSLESSKQPTTPSPSPPKPSHKNLHSLCPFPPWSLGIHEPTPLGHALGRNRRLNPQTPAPFLRRRLVHR